jgi:hypothetical protein
MSEDRCLARLLRFAVVSRLYADGRLDLPVRRDFSWPVDAGDDSTIVDDSQLMHMPYEAGWISFESLRRRGEMRLLEDCQPFAERHRNRYVTSGPHWSLIIRS